MNKMQQNNVVTVIGAGLAGCEAAYRLSKAEIRVRLIEMKPKKMSEAHKNTGFAELVCSNSLKSDRVDTASGLLKAEMRLLDSLVLDVADKCKVPAGGALAVDRDSFSSIITDMIKNEPNIEIIEQEAINIPDDGYVIIATGPLTSDKFAESITELCGGESLSFFDAAAPILTYASINTDKAFFASRYGKGDDDYINCPFEHDEYEAFYDALVNAELAPLKEFDKNAFRVYEGCMPIEAMAKRGKDTIRFGPLKPVGLTNPKTGSRPYAVVQLRSENKEGTLYNIVGFQTNLKFSEQKRVFSMIPGLENAEFMRYGVMHRNTFINSPKLLNEFGCLKKQPRIYFAGQITGVEGYIESAASGIIAGEAILRLINGQAHLKLPRETMLGALYEYISDSRTVNFQPMGSNMGILPPLNEKVRDKRLRYEMLSNRALDKLKEELN